MEDLKDRREEYEEELAELTDEKQYLSDCVLLEGPSNDLLIRQIKVKERIDLLLESLDHLSKVGVG